MPFSAILKKLKYPIDEIRIIQYIDYGERRNIESRIAPILVKREKMTEPAGSEMHTPHRGGFYPSKHGNYPKWIKMIFDICPDITSGQVCFCW